MSTDQRVRHHFELDARRFDAIYEDNKGAVSRFIDNVWRGVVRKRLDLTLRQLAPFAGKTVLDVGCGSGRYCFEYVKHGAQHVVGVDFAAPMIDIAHDLAKRIGVADRCEFRVGRFPEAVPDGPFDYSTAMGFFDYIEDAVPILKAMRQKTSQAMVMSFPKAIEWRVPVRRIRFLVSGCPLYLYTRKDVKSVLAAAGIQHYEFINLDRDYIVIARMKDVRN